MSSKITELKAHMYETDKEFRLKIHNIHQSNNTVTENLQVTIDIFLFLCVFLVMGLFFFLIIDMFLYSLLIFNLAFFFLVNFAVSYQS